MAFPGPWLAPPPGEHDSRNVPLFSGLILWRGSSIPAEPSATRDDLYSLVMNESISPYTVGSGSYLLIHSGGVVTRTLHTPTSYVQEATAIFVPSQADLWPLGTNITDAPFQYGAPSPGAPISGFEWETPSAVAISSLYWMKKRPGSDDSDTLLSWGVTKPPSNSPVEPPPLEAPEGTSFILQTAYLGTLGYQPGATSVAQPSLGSIGWSERGSVGAGAGWDGESASGAEPFELAISSPAPGFHAITCRLGNMPGNDEPHHWSAGALADRSWLAYRSNSRYRWLYTNESDVPSGGGGDRQVVDEPVRAVSSQGVFAGAGASQSRSSFEPRPL